MEPLYIPTESDFKRWIREVILECLSSPKKEESADAVGPLLNRQEIAKFLRISLVTLTDWTKRGLPSHKQRGRVYFDKKEVLDYIKEKKIHKLNFTSRLGHLKSDFSQLK